MGGPPRGLRDGNDIFRAAVCGSDGAVRHLLRTVPGAAAETISGSGSTALHIAANIGHSELCRVLLAAGAEVDARESRGLSAEDCGAG